jgi:hypothetical protein
MMFLRLTEFVSVESSQITRVLSPGVNASQLIVGESQDLVTKSSETRFFLPSSPSSVAEETTPDRTAG